ncbi:MAG: cupin domain-containing protein [Leptospiraceae bacterium]
MNHRIDADARPADISNDAVSFSNSDLITFLRKDELYAKEGKTARTLVRSNNLTIILTVLKEGNGLQPHKAPGPIHVIVLDGQLSFRVSSQEGETLSAKDSIVVPSGHSHSVQAITDCAFMITIGGKE